MRFIIVQEHAGPNPEVFPNHEISRFYEINLWLGRSDMSKTTGKCLECSVRSYDSDGQLIRETMIDVEEGNWGGKELRLSAIISNP